MSKTLQFIAIFILLPFLSSTAFSDDINIVSGPLAPFSYLDKGEHVGVMTEIAQEIFKRVGKKFNPTIYPWPRAVMLSTKDKTVSFPMARVPYREGKYLWVGPLLYDKHVFLVHKDDKGELKTEDDMKKVTVGVLRNAPPDRILTKRGYKKLNKRSTSAQLATMIKKKRIQAWYDLYAIMTHTFRLENIDEKLFKVAIDDVKIKQHIALSKDLAPLAKKMQEVFEAIKRDGTYNRILKKYKFVNHK